MPSGCTLRFAGELGKQHQICYNRISANWVGALHVFILGGARIMLTNSQAGAGFDVLAAMRLEMSWSEKSVGILVSVASMIALFLFSTRESDETFETTTSLFHILFSACWLVACAILAFNTTSARESRTRRRNAHPPRPNHTMPGRNQDDHGSARGAAAATTIVTLPPAWSCVMVSFSLLTYTAPQMMRFAFRSDKVRGAIGSFSNLCLVAHLMMISNNERSSARNISVVHLGVHLAGNACTFGSDSRNMGFSVGLALSYLITMCAAVFQFWLWNRVMRPMLASRNPKLLSDLPITVFRWFFQRGVLTMALYCYFEALGVGADLERSSEDIQPWLNANNCVISQFTMSGFVSLTMLADARTSLSAVLRGRAPLHVTAGLAMTIFTSCTVLVMFAGREWGGADQKTLYDMAYACFMFLWFIIGGIVTAGQYAPRKRQRAKTAELANRSATRSEEECDDDIPASSERITFSEFSGSTAITAGI